ncbi:50S ribosomal protein L11 methyltransferase [Desertimonas flava]|uniref:50S ribosomal protein L11 methyltransferase n=1 Tax=Desertimonas flava TaxID=2064846 RepID=UPI0013C45FF9|nr:50S ribosomal protein L11 methyltransferase [Desertimonas flava]
MTIVVAAPAADVDGVVTRLRTLGADGVNASSTGTGRWLVRATTPDEATDELLVQRLRAEGLIAVARPNAGVRLDAWMEHTRPRVFAGRVSVCFAWTEHDRANLAGLVELGLGGFGNGEHPTTAMLIDELLDRVAGGERVLDVGCGSGVLGLCALRLGAGELVAVDVKPDAVEATRRNALLNRVDAVTMATTAPLGEIDGPFDVIVANIGRGALVELAPELRRLLAPEGWLGVSGFSPVQREQVADFLRPLATMGHRSVGDWSAAVLSGPVRRRSR